jgi:hypothetical protein
MHRQCDEFPWANDKKIFGLGWGERHGLYFVRSAYRLHVEQEAHTRNHGEGRASHSIADNDPH